MKGTNRKLSAAVWLVLPAVLMSVAVAQAGDKKSQKKSGEPAPTAGCESREVKSGTEKGQQERFFAAPPQKVKDALVGALAALEFEIDKKKMTDTDMEATKRRHVGVFVGSGGERVVLHLAEAEEGGKKGTRVTGETKKGFVGRAGQKSWTNAVLDQADCMMEKGS